MATNDNFSKEKRVTHYSREFCGKMTSAESLYSSLSAGSKKRLSQYQKNLCVSRGWRPGDDNFDDRVIDIIKKYARHPSDVNSQIRYLNGLKDPEGYNFSRNLKIYSTTEKAMKLFSEPDYTSFRWNENYQKSLEQTKKEFNFSLTPLSFTSDDDVRDALPKESTHSGYYYILSGKKRKGDNMDGIFEIYTKRLKSALETGSFNNPILLGFRTQASGEYDDYGNQTGTCKHKLRVVSMFDLINIIAELTFAKPFQQRLAKEWSYAGGKDEHGISSIISTWRSRYDYFRSIDYSSFDQTISSWLIEDAFSVVKHAFGTLSEEEDKLFNLIVHDFIHKRFIVNEGIVESHRGVPSGSMFTQIIDSIVNIIVVRTFYNSVGKEAKMIVMGDDNAIFTNCDIPLSELASYVGKNFGLSVKVDDKSNEGRTKIDDIKFLSRYWKDAGQWRHPHQLLSRLAFPERWRNYNDEVRPEHVVFAFILTYKLGMEELMNVPMFFRDYPMSRKIVEDNVDSRYLPGSMAYIKEYGQVAS